MTGIDLIVFSIVCYSLSYGWIESPLFKGGKLHAEISKIHPYLITCFHCVGFWVGLVVGWGMLKTSGVDYLINGLLGSGVCLILDKVMLWFESGIREESV